MKVRKRNRGKKEREERKRRKKEKKEREERKKRPRSSPPQTLNHISPSPFPTAQSKTNKN